jgi:integrase
MYAVFMPYTADSKVSHAMPRKARDERLNTRTARLALSPRREPYWRNIQDGRAIGYRRLAGGKAGTWIARHYNPTEGRRYSALGTADDLMEADGAATLTFGQAQTKALTWFAQIERNAGRAVADVTVAEAMAAYVADYTARGGRALADLRRTIDAHILPTFGSMKLSDLTFSRLKAWHHGLADAPARLRTKASAKMMKVRRVDGRDSEGRRARRATANRVWTVFRAALSLAYREGRVSSDDAWRRVKPFANVGAARVRYLTDQEAVRLVNACAPDFRKLVTAALLTGARFGELTALQVRDLDLDAAVLHIRTTKAGKPRSVPLSDDGTRFFGQLAAGKARDALMLPREDGTRWRRSHQFRPLREACIAAKIVPAISFHILRHTLASRLAREGVPMAIIAEALGNSEVVCSRHYAHLSRDFVSDTIRRYAGGMGIVSPERSVQPMHKRPRVG